MDMILVMVYLFEKYLWIVLGDIEQFPFHIGEQAIVEYFSAIFGRKDEMKITQPDTMMAPSVVTFHASILALQGDEYAGTRLHPRAYARGIYARIKG